MEMLFLAKWMHIIGSTILLGTGAGIAFFMVMAHRTGDTKLIAHTASFVVIADFLFTASAVVVQPLTGIWLTQILGWSLTESWIMISLLLYVFIGVFWLPVVWIQMKLKSLALAAAEAGEPLPPTYFRFYRLWFAFGFPAFFAVLAIFWLMIAKPIFW